MKNKINYVEVVDDSDRPLARMNIAEAHRQSLKHRSVIVLLYDSSGELYLQKRSSTKKQYPSRWDVSTSGHVFVTESRKDAAHRVLWTELGIQNAKIKELDKIEASSETGYEFITIYILAKMNVVSTPNPDEVERGYYYSANELDWLIRECRELLTPTLVFLHELEMLYKMK
ncbi:NUDIX hydrolase [Maridesulfovibrio frigidus]|uniref:NUDIX hydrolase n=1 Tax=Maridesulfovibrio frigidus TaxID=340956 RepID=UPI0004E234C2|nr:NUDIX domain-containing protein [Maridesulfovibrio frigidus]